MLSVCVVKNIHELPKDSRSSIIYEKYSQYIKLNSIFISLWKTCGRLNTLIVFMFFGVAAIIKVIKCLYIYYNF